jgi:hypothetical protein
MELEALKRSSNGEEVNCLALKRRREWVRFVRGLWVMVTWLKSTL